MTRLGVSSRSHKASWVCPALAEAAQSQGQGFGATGRSTRLHPAGFRGPCHSSPWGEPIPSWGSVMFNVCFDFREQTGEGYLVVGLKGWVPTKPKGSVFPAERREVTRVSPHAARSGHHSA